MDNTQILNGLKDVNKGAFAYIEYKSEVKGVKRLLNGAEVTKVVKANIQLNYDYESAVNRRLEKQGDNGNFTAQSLPYGQWLIPNKVITHNGKLYLRAYQVSGARVETTYFINGAVATNEQRTLLNEHFAQKNNNSNTQESVGLVENQVKPFNVAFENIIALRCGNCQLI